MNIKVTVSYQYWIGSRSAQRTISAEWPEGPGLGSPAERIRSVSEELLRVATASVVATREEPPSGTRSAGMPT